MQILLIFAAIYGAMLSTSFWEAYVEGRFPWDKRKLGWKIRIGESFIFSAYHFFLFWITFPLLLSLPLIVNGWDTELFGILTSAYFSGIIIEDFVWFIVNPNVHIKEFWSDFTDFYPWIKIQGQKILPYGYVLGVLISVSSWLLLWQ